MTPDNTPSDAPDKAPASPAEADKQPTPVETPFARIKRLALAHKAEMDRILGERYIEEHLPVESEGERLERLMDDSTAWRRM
jgi:hypothetical protein